MRTMKNAGMSLVQVIVVAAIIGGLSVTLGTLISNALKASKNVDIKTQTQNFGSEMRLATASSAGCKGVLDLVSNPIDISASELPSKTNSITSYTYNVPTLKIAGTNYTVGTTLQDLKVKALEIIFSPPIEPNQYLVTLNATLERKNPSGSGPMGYVQGTRLLLQTTTENGRIKVTDCWSQSAPTDAEKTCDELGGRWLTGEFMPKERCNMTSEIDLKMNEAPDGIPRLGEANDETKERIETCLYSGRSNKVTAYSCRSSSGTRADYKCVFNTNPTAKRWELRFVPRTGVNWSKGLRYICERGVKVSMKSPGSEMLAARDELYMAFGDTAFSTNEEKDALATVSRCQYVADGEFYQTCKNATDPNAALTGAVGSCIYVRGVKLPWTTQKTVDTTYNNSCDGDSSCTISTTNYTGWIMVRSARTYFNPKVSGKVTPMIREALGIPCYSVEINSAALIESNLSELTTDAPTSEQIEMPSKVKQCVYSAGASEKVNLTGSYGIVASAPTRRQQFLPCNNDFEGGDAGGTNTVVNAWTGTGTAADDADTPSMLNGSCWYFNNVKIQTYYPGTVSPPAPTASTYTGWVRLQANLPDAAFQPLGKTTTSYILEPASDPKKQKTLNAIPCTDGIRTESIPSS